MFGLVKRFFLGIPLATWVAVLIVVQVVGMMVDVWAHDTGLVSDQENVLLAWNHYVIYAGWTFMALAFFVHVNAMRRHGESFFYVTPKPWRLLAIGIPLQMVGFVGDAIWHQVFGVEATIEGLFSPTHMLLTLGFLMVLGSLLYNFCYQTIPGSTLTWRQSWGAVVSLSALWFALHGLTHYVNAWVNQWPLRESVAALGLSPELEVGFLQQYGPNWEFFTLIPGGGSMIVSTFFLLGLVLTLGRRYSWPLGTWVIVFMSGALIAGVFYDPRLLLVAMVLGVLLELLMVALNPVHNQRNARFLTILIPFTLFAVQMVGYHLLGEVTWSIHATTGMVAKAVVIGLVAGLIIMPPAWLRSYEDWIEV